MIQWHLESEPGCHQNSIHLTLFLRHVITTQNHYYCWNSVAKSHAPLMCVVITI